MQFISMNYHQYHLVKNLKHNQPYEVKLLTNIAWINYVKWIKSWEI